MNKDDEFSAADALIGLASTNSNLSALKKAHEDIGLTFDNGGKCVKFPVKLMQIVDCELLNNIISWTPDGLSFTIHKPSLLEKKVIPLFYDTTSHHHTKYKSFLRKLYRWGFLKKYHQSNEFTYFHKFFQRGNLDLCLRITRESNAKNLKSIRALAGNNGSNALQSHQDIATDLTTSHNPNTVPIVSPIPPATATMTSTSTDAYDNNSSLLLNHLKRQIFLDQLVATTGSNATASPTFEPPISRSIPFSTDNINEMLSVLSNDASSTSPLMPIQDSQSRVDNRLLRELKKGLILDKLLSNLSTETRSSNFPHPASRTSSLGAINETMLSMKPLPRHSYPSMSNNVSLATANCLLNNSCNNQEMNRDKLLTTSNNDITLLPPFIRSATSAATTTPTPRRSTVPSFSPQTRLKLNEANDRSLKHFLFQCTQKQTIQRTAHSNLMSAAFNDLVERQKMLETAKHNFVDVPRK